MERRIAPEQKTTIPGVAGRGRGAEATGPLSRSSEHTGWSWWVILTRVGVGVGVGLFQVEAFSFAFDDGPDPGDQLADIHPDAGVAVPGARLLAPGGHTHLGRAAHAGLFLDRSRARLYEQAVTRMERLFALTTRGPPESPLQLSFPLVRVHMEVSCSILCRSTGISS
jgi:hypothetical protein